jgi:DNA-binding CsgD family transcriptional regulator
MAAQGKTNRQIAEARSLSIKTVEQHLHHAYQKLEVGSRHELPEALGSDSRGDG